MTIDEIRALISAKIAGQGDAIDAGGALPAILNGLLDAVDKPLPRFVIHGRVEEDEEAEGEYHAYATLTPPAGYVPKLGDMVEVVVEWSGVLPSEDAVSWNGTGIGYLSPGPTILYVSQIVPIDTWEGGSWVLADKHNLDEAQQAAAIAFDSPVLDINDGSIPLMISYSSGGWFLTDNG